MSHSSETLHYHLPKYVGTDIINPLTDFNNANDVIDEALYDANSAAANAVEKAEEAEANVGNFDARITAAEVAASAAASEAASVVTIIAPAFNPLKEGGYAIGAYVTKITDNVAKLYQFTSAHSGAWTGNDVRETTVAEMLVTINVG